MPVHVLLSLAVPVLARWAYTLEVFTGRLWPWLAGAWGGLGRVGCKIRKIPAVAMAMAAKF